MKPVAILGASGRLGGLLRAVWPADHPALWISRKSGEGLIQCDMLRQPDALTGLLKDADSILCLAGVTHSGNQDLALNTMLAKAAIRAARQAGVGRVFLTSSAAVYGAQSGVLTEDGPCRPVSDYGRAKLEMERRGAQLGQQLDMSVTSLRIANIAGADAILGGWREGFALDRFDNGLTPRRSYIGLVTLAEVLSRLTQTQNLPGVLNVAAPGTIEMDDLLDAAGMAWSARPAPSSAIPAIELSISRLEKHFDFDVGVGAPQELVDQWRQATGT